MFSLCSMILSAHICLLSLSGVFRFDDAAVVSFIHHFFVKFPEHVHQVDDAADGNELNVARYNGPGSDSDHAYAIVTDIAGDVYVTGYSIGSGTNNDYTTIKYSSFASGCAYEITGDINSDCKVDFSDLALLVERWLDCNLDPPQACWQ